ncbi:MAG: pyrroloquinoline quinone-dependent dehydrogenase [Acidobacteria bacterium]|nr:MAG: pyrroloquinoline quinone-dependent dehydrogenase [Acidobacteriota bacterium]
MRSAFLTAGLGVLAAMLLVDTGRSQGRTAGQTGADWPMYRHDLAGTGHSPLTQIDVKNVGRLAQAWTYRLQNDDAPPPTTGRGGAGGPNSEATPIVVNGVMYLPAANRVVALEPESGKEIWRFPVVGGAPSRRGVAYWPGDGARPANIIFTAGRRLIAINARTGTPDRAFGQAGEVDMVVPYNSVPLVHRNVVVVGANTPGGGVRGLGNPRAFDARTGAKLWEFSAISQPGSVGHDTWEGESWKGRVGANAWPFYFTVDERRNLVYLPLASPEEGSYGGDRKGANLFGNSVVAVDLLTGAYRWHFQTIHHDLWDADPAAPPGLFDIARGGRTIPALGVTTKSGYLYLLNRETGQPIFGVEERPVPKSDVPGELTFPTQPFPLKPPAIARNSYKPEDLVAASDTTPDHAKACAELVSQLGGVFNAGPFTPWVYRPEGTPIRNTLVFPGGLGGANWGGTAYDPTTHYLFIATQDVGALGWVEKARDGSPVPYDKVTPPRTGPGRGTFDIVMPGGNWPCQKPPWGRLMAVNTLTGDIQWQIPLGITEQLPQGKQNTGRPVLAGAIATAGGVLFIASTDDNRFRALDSKTGKELWVTKLDRRGNANPLTYQGRDGKQYVAVVATDTLTVYALPSSRP